MFPSKKTVLILIIIGVAAGTVALKVEKPEYGLEDRGDWGDVTSDSINITTEGYIYNPNPFAVNLSFIQTGYKLEMNGIELARGGKEALSIGARKNNTVEVETTVDPGKVPEWWVTHMRNNEESRLNVPLTLDLQLFGKQFSVDGISYRDRVETDLESKMDRAVSQLTGSYSWSLTGAEVSETEIEIADGSGEFGRINRENTRLLVDLEIRNPNSYPIATPQLNGELVMNSIEIARWQANEVTVKNAPENGAIPPGATREIRLKAEISNERIDDWFISHAAQREQTTGEINLRLGFDVADQTLQVPREGNLKCDFNFQTGILVDDQETASEFGGCEQQSREPGLENLEEGESDQSSQDFTEEEENQNDSSSSGEDDGLTQNQPLF